MESHRDRVVLSFPIGSRRDLESRRRSIFLSRGEIPPKARLLHKRYDVSPIGNYCWLTTCWACYLDYTVQQGPDSSQLPSISVRRARRSDSTYLNEPQKTNIPQYEVKHFKFTFTCLFCSVLCKRYSFAWENHFVSRVACLMNNDVQIFVFLHVLPCSALYAMSEIYARRRRVKWKVQLFKI